MSKLVRYLKIFVALQNGVWYQEKRGAGHFCHGVPANIEWTHPWNQQPPYAKKRLWKHCQWFEVIETFLALLLKKTFLHQ